jgi:hypothetical protein
MTRAITAGVLLVTALVFLHGPAEARHCCKRYYSAFSYHFPKKATPAYRVRTSRYAKRGYGYRAARGHRVRYARRGLLFVGGYRNFPVYTPYLYWNGGYGFYPRFDNRDFFERVISGPYVGKSGGFHAGFQ